jgi:luciferase family oxidoreductase group 1
VRAIPGESLRVPVWLLGSSLFSAQLAAALGLPFAFASHFAPDLLLPALQTYRRNFRASEFLEHPYVMLGLNVVAAQTDAEARFLFTSIQQQFTNLRRGMPTRLPAPVASMDGLWSAMEEENAAHTLQYAVVGGREETLAGIESFIELTHADELLITSHIHDHTARLHSFEMVGGMHDAGVGSGIRKRVGH